MAVIPRQVYDDCERKLYQRDKLVRVASENLMIARSKAYSAGCPMPEPLPSNIAKRRGANPNAIHGNNVRGDQVERSALSIIQAEAAMCTALKWAEVFSRLDEIFAGKPEADIAEAIYQKHKQQNDVAKTLHYDRQSIRRYRDVYVCHCALLAAEKGLITIEGGCEDGQESVACPCGS